MWRNGGNCLPCNSRMQEISSKSMLDLVARQHCSTSSLTSVKTLQCNGSWYYRSPVAVMENDLVKLSWDFRIQIDHHLDHNRPGIVVLEKIIDLACPFDTRKMSSEDMGWQYMNSWDRSFTLESFPTENN